jgi:hypothetical protein
MLKLGCTCTTSYQSVQSWVMSAREVGECKICVSLSLSLSLSLSRKETYPKLIQEISFSFTWMMDWYIIYFSLFDDFISNSNHIGSGCWMKMNNEFSRLWKKASCPNFKKYIEIFLERPRKITKNFNPGCRYSGRCSGNLPDKSWKN